MTKSRSVTGWTRFAAVLLVFGGAMTILAGISAIANDRIFFTTRHYLFTFDVIGWGWAHLILGIVILLAGLSLFNGATWARIVAVILAGLGAVANFLWIPHYPLWALTLLAIDIVIIWALCAGDRRSHT